MAAPAHASILTYLVTKRLTTEASENLLAAKIEGSRVTKTGPREYLLKGYVRDTDLDTLKPSLGKNYGLQSFTSTNP